MKIKSGMMIAALVIIGIVALSAFALANGGFGQARALNNGDIKKAIEAGDYTAFMQALKAANITAPKLTGMNQDDFNKLSTSVKQKEQKFADMQAKRQQVQDAIKNNDYNAWKTAMATDLSQDKFNQIETQYQQMQQKRSEMNASRQKINLAIQNNDYNAWLQAITVNGKAPKIAEKINKDNFPTYVKLVQAINSKDFVTAKNLSTTLGINMSGKDQGFMGFGKGMMGHFGRPPMFGGQFRHGKPGQ